MTNKKSLFKTRTGLILVASMFVLSPVLAWMFYTGIIGDGYEPGAGKNYGELVHPARPLENIQLLDGESKPVNREKFLGLWTTLQIVEGSCDEGCLANVYNMRQIQQALGKDAYRAQYFVLVRDISGQTEMVKKFPGVPLLQMSEQTKPMLEQFPGYSDGDISSISGRIYIIDPLGNLMMQYPHKADPSKILKDLHQLLKATWIRPRN